MYALTGSPNVILPSSELLRGVRWFETDVSVLPVGPIFKGQAVLLRVKMSKNDTLTPKGGTYR
jgi:hypothetical protein